MKRTLTLALILSSLLFAGCNAKLTTSTSVEGVEASTEPTTTPQETIAPKSTGSESETNLETDVHIDAPALKKSDDVQSLEADLNATIITEETFD